MVTSVLSLNVWGGRLHGPLLDYLVAADADVICLQEVTRTPGRGHGWLDYRDGDIVLPQRTNLFAEVAAALPGHDGLFMPAARGVLHDGDVAVPSEFGLATFWRTSLSLIGQAQGFVHGGFLADRWGDHPRARNAHVIRVHDHAADFTATIAQMHGLRDPAGKADTPARLAQAEALAGLIRSVWRVEERLVVCGDFNVLPESRTFSVLAELGLTDLVTGRGFADTRTSLYAKPGRFADYMLVNQRVSVTSFDVVAEPEVSDHRPLLLAFG
ncbi:MAG: endonuclease/exonuclease/phosphatase family protein [Bosea sp.]|nr:endonuclease/exonuclease/phosphatase family protein [Bosea sp. (in: a-proteobacteria)]